MNRKSGTSKDAADKLLRGIKRKTRKHYSSEEKIRIVLAGLHAEESIAALCCRKRIAESLYYSWSKEFFEAGKARLASDTARQATAPEVKELRSESAALKELVAELTLENRLLKKACLGMGATTNEILGIPSSTYYDWYARWVEGGLDALADRSPHPRSVWNRIPEDVREAFVACALYHEDLTPRELGWRQARRSISETARTATQVLKSLTASSSNTLILSCNS